MGAIIDGSYQNYYDPMLGQKLPLVFDAEKEVVSNSIFSITTGLVSGDLLNPIKTLGSIFCGIGKKSANPTETTPGTQQPEETLTEESVEETNNELKNFISDLYQGNIDNLLNSYLGKWKLDQIGIVERQILRLGAYEMKYSDIDLAIAINEAVILANELASESSIKLINGVLDAIAKDK